MEENEKYDKAFKLILRRISNHQNSCEKSVKLSTLGTIAFHFVGQETGRHILSGAARGINTSEAPVAQSTALLAIGNAWRVFGYNSNSLKICERAWDILSRNWSCGCCYSMALTIIHLALIKGSHNCYELINNFIERSKGGTKAEEFLVLAQVFRLYVNFGNFEGAINLLNCLGPFEDIAFEAASSDLIHLPCSSHPADRANWLMGFAQNKPTTLANIILWNAKEGCLLQAKELYNKLTCALNNHYDCILKINTLSMVACAFKQCKNPEGFKLIDVILQLLSCVTHSEMDYLNTGAIVRALACYNEVEMAMQIAPPRTNSWVI